MSTATLEKPVTSTKTNPAESLLYLLVEKHLNLKEKGKALYSEADQVFEQIREHMKPGQRMFLSDGRVFEFTDNFEKSNVCFRPAGVKRFELLEVSKTKLQKGS